MPALSPTMEEGTLAKWLVKEGDTVKSGDILAEIETDKATMEFEAVDEGIMGKILVAEGTAGVKVNTPIAILVEEPGKARMTAPVAKAAPAVAVVAAAAAPVTAPPAAMAAQMAAMTAQTRQPMGRGSRPRPLARRLAKEKGVDLTTLSGTGPHGRIIKADVESVGPSGANPALTPCAVANPRTSQPSAPAAPAAMASGRLRRHRSCQDV